MLSRCWRPVRRFGYWYVLQRRRVTQGTAGQSAPVHVGDHQGVGEVSDVPMGGGKLVGSILFVHRQAGVIKAFDARCPHQGTMLIPQRMG